MVVLVDRHAADNLGMVVLSAQHATAAALQELARIATGSSYLALTDERCEELGLRLVGDRDDVLAHAPVTATISARHGLSTGVSVEERARTISVAIDPTKRREDIRLGGHVFPLRGRPGGVLERAGHTEASIDLCRLAGLAPTAVLGEIVDDAGATPQGERLVDFARRAGLPLVTIDDLILHRRRTERVVRRAVTTNVTSTSGRYVAVGYQDLEDQSEHLALVREDVAQRDDVLVYIHVACWEGDVFRSRRCACRTRLDAAKAAITHAGRGVIVYLAHPGAFLHPERNRAEQLRDLGVAAQILTDLGIATFCLLGDGARSAAGFDHYGLRISGQRALPASSPLPASHHSDPVLPSSSAA